MTLTISLHYTGDSPNCFVIVELASYALAKGAQSSGWDSGEQHIFAFSPIVVHCQAVAVNPTGVFGVKF